MQFAQILNNVIVNIIQLDDTSLLPLFAVGFDTTPIQVDNLSVMPSIGWQFDALSREFYPPYGPSIAALSNQMSAPSGNTASCTVDFGFNNGLEGDTAIVTVPATWVTISTILVCSVAAVFTANHDPEDAVIEGIQAYPINVIPGVSFDIECRAPNNSWGQYYINVIGI